jgi:hypothetical protein
MSLSPAIEFVFDAAVGAAVGAAARHAHTVLLTTLTP